MRYALFGLTALLLCTPFVNAAEPMPAEVREKLDALTGTWRGTFEVFTQDGRLHEQLDVMQEYRWDGHVQRGRFVEIDAEGDRTTADARNFVDDRGRLVCEVVKSNGETTRHLGRLVRKSIAWHRRGEEVIETFIERVNTQAQPAVYQITGVGAYGPAAARSHFVFRGRYERVSGDGEIPP